MINSIRGRGVNVKGAQGWEEVFHLPLWKANTEFQKLKLIKIYKYYLEIQVLI